MDYSNGQESREGRFIKEFHQKRELTYCLLSVIANCLIPAFWFVTGFDLVEHARQNEELPTYLLLYIGSVELFKVVLVLVMYPLSNVSGTSIRERRRVSVELGGVHVGGYEEFEGPDEEEHLEIPKYDGVKIWGREESALFGNGKRGKDDVDEDDDNDDDRRQRTGVDRVSWFFKVLEIIKGIFTFVLAVGAGHVLIVLFGAPVLVDKLLTLQFSFIVVTWLFLPLCINIPPATVILEVLFMRFWDINIEWVYRSQLRFIATLFGAWCGAIVFPLDWDRPWQSWPVPCVVSVFAFYTLYHGLLLLYLAGLIYWKRFRQFVALNELKKVKVY